MVPAGLVAALVFVFGMAIGSFLNVCILRIPEGKSIVLPASACPKCGAGIKPYDNVPVVSWLLLRGKCRACGEPISPMYPLVELLTGLLFLGAFLAFGVSLEAAKWAAFSALIMVLFFSDLRERILPDVVNFTGFGLAVLLSFFVPIRDGTALWISNRLFDFPPPVPILSFADALLGAGIGSGFLWIVSEGYFRVRGREGMGLGDVKMMLMAGSFLGLKRTVLTILVASLLGSVIGLVFILAKRKGRDYELPFGCFLGAGAMLVVFFGGSLVSWYASLFTRR